jgi:integrase
MSLYRPSGSRIWWFDFHFSGQRIRESTKMSSRTRAREVEEKRKQELRDGAAGIRKRETPKLFSVAFLEWTEAKQSKWSPRMLDLAENSMKHLGPAFGRKLAMDIEPPDIARYQKARLAEGASNRTVNIEIGCVRSVLKLKGYWARIQPRIEMLVERDDVGRALTADEQVPLLEECGFSRSRILRPFVVLALETAARYGTLRRLQWKNADFANRCLTFGKDKTRSGSNRTIPLTPRAFETLRFWSDSFPDRKPDHFVFPHERYGASGTNEIVGFTAAKVYETDPTRPTGSVKVAWEQARNRTRRHCPQCKAGRLADAVKPSTGYVCDGCQWQADELPAGLASIRFHDLRHTGVSRMINAKIPLPIIGKIVGWSASTLAKMAARYGHFSLEEMRSALDSIGRAPDEISVGYPQKSPKSAESEEGRIQ